jgi:hypothetical protein
MPKAKIVLNKRGVRELLTSPGALKDVERRARQIAAAAGGETDYRVDSQVGKNRARAAVITDTWRARAAEAKRRTLTKAIDAGRR